MIKGFAGRVLEVDLEARTAVFRPLDEAIARLYLGGKGYGTRLLYDLTPPGIDPLGPENPLIFATGPLNGSLAPQSNRFAVVCKSPLTGGIGSSACGGSFAFGMKKAGIDVLVVRGRSAGAVRLEIDGDADEVRFLDASDLWGLGTGAAQKALGKGMHHAVIGPGGENLVLYAGIVSDARIAGRCGVGAVMGSKRLKALSIQGTRKLDMEDEAGFKKYTQWVRQVFKGHPVLGEKLRRFGTMGIVNTTNGRNMIPTRNFQEGHHPDAMGLSGEYLEDHGLAGVRSSCLHCPVACGREVEVPGAGRVKGPEYETVGMMGTNLGVTDLEKVSHWNWMADELGLDTISLGVTLGFAMELQERGMLETGLRFGRAEGVAEMIEAIAHRRGLGDDLAQGTRRMSEKYGGKAFAMHVKGLELSAYDPRGSYAQGVEYATTNRGGCHVQGASMYFESTGPLTINPQNLKLKAELPVVQQNLACAVNSMVLCIFTTYGLIPRQVHALKPGGWTHRLARVIFENSGPAYRLIMGSKLLQVTWLDTWLSRITGLRFTPGHLQEIGARIFNLERMYNLREGLTGADDTLPERILREPLFKGMDSGHPLDQLLPRYYRIRGWDSHGVPLPETLRKLKVRT
ncbi:aldehyde ferredoxin oxidoreductase family protein [Mesoterricola silvestris]|uniref:Aldehyde ferredoxin oxidoreductase n=1 Tax=Mesoterricola silvestris TaxID=2927979 RepID=A0AA48GIK2_9BACT|nr:aldehyde ferredoxin oxidoreductase family protein [Mesoterricola silvestris]BDU71679.1 aldehyde ferredoxin oxidoreductase [Mesoterricola silvestris]